MKALSILTAAVLLLATHTTGASTAHTKHHNGRANVHAAAHVEQDSGDAVQEETKQLFQVTGTSSSFKALFHDTTIKHKLDVWSIRPIGNQKASQDPELQADIYTTKMTMHAVTTKKTLDVTIGHGRIKAHVHTPSWKFHVKAGRDYDAMAAADRKRAAACLDKTDGFMADLDTLAHYTDSAFFDCFRPYEQVIDFFDALTDANDDVMVKYENVSTTYQGRSIAAYRLSTTGLQEKMSKDDDEAVATVKQALYTQALIHSREWQAGASTFFTIASLLDGIRAQDPDVLALFDMYDWFFVPVVNIDGYKYSWETDRYWRLNRDPTHGYGGVDLNRNWGPDEYFNLDPTDVDEETNPGPYPLSEPETAGLYAFITSIDRMAGLVDMHAYGGLVLRPFSDVTTEPEEPYRSAMRQLGDAVRDAISRNTTLPYVSEPSGALYPAYGCFDDAFFRYYNFTVPSITIEVEGTDFTADPATIRTVGEKLYRGLRTFADQVTQYQDGIEDGQ